MPKVSDDHRAGRRRQISNAALRCFARKGFEGTSMTDIIAESGLSAGAIYLHYKNKQDLVAAVVGEVVATRSLDMEALIARSPLPHPVEVLRAFVTGATDEIGGAHILVQVWSIAAREPELAALVVELMTELRKLFAGYFELWFVARGLPAEQAAARAQSLAPLVVGICQGYLLQAAVMPGFDADEYLDAVALLDFAA